MNGRMDDTISRQAAIELLQNNIAYMRAFGCDRAVTLIRALPSAEPEITHCADCIHWKHSAARKSYCEVFDWMSKAEDFCSFAERKDDDDNGTDRVIEKA